MTFRSKKAGHLIAYILNIMPEKNSWFILKRIIILRGKTDAKINQFYSEAIHPSREKVRPVRMIGLSNLVFIGEAVWSANLKLPIWGKNIFSFNSLLIEHCKKFSSLPFSPFGSKF